MTSRGDGREAIYLDNANRVLFLNVLAQTCEQFNSTVHAWCLMANHYHLPVENLTPIWPATCASFSAAIEQYKAFVVEGRDQPSVWEQIKTC